MNTIDPAIGQVLAAQQNAARSDIRITLEAKRQDVMRAEGEAINELLQASGQSVRQPGKGGLFDSTG